MNESGQTLFNHEKILSFDSKNAKGGSSADVFSSSRSQKIIFANQLRGLAAIFVVISHLIGIYWGGRQIVADNTATPLLTQPISPIFYVFEFHWLKWGSFGVAIFFLISGLVIPISLAQHTRMGFILARLLRIYPTFMVGFSVSLSVIAFNCYYWNTHFTDSIWAIFGTFFLIHDALGVRDVSMVSWTLCIELKFYLIMVCISPSIQKGSTAALFAVAFALLAYSFSHDSALLNSARAEFPSFFASLDYEGIYITYMLIGVLFNFKLQGFLRWGDFLVALFGMLVIVTASWLASTSNGDFPVITCNYYLGVIVFLALFSVRRYARPFFVLDFLADVSFPLYVIHSIVGFSILKIFMLGLGISYHSSLAFTVASLLCISWLIHVTVERWSIRVGKRLTIKGRSGRRTASLEPNVR